ncbi:MAG: ATP-binding protein [Desulfobacula sp.]|jgi:signal transduction histidine kinase
MHEKGHLDNVHRLKSLQFFSRLDEHILEQFRKNCVVCSISAGETVFLEGDESSGIYFIESGKVEISKRGVPFAILDAGDYFGEMSVVIEDEHTRSATARALDDLVLFQIDPGFIRDYFVHERLPIYDLVLTYNTRLKKHNDKVVDQYLSLQKNYMILEETYRQLLNTEKLASIGTLTAGIAHEINNPLTIILGYTGMLLKDPDLGFTGPFFQKGIGHIDKAANAIEKIVRDIKNYVRTNPDEVVKMNFNHTVQATLDLVSYLYRKNKITIHTSFSFQKIEIRGNPGSLQQVVMNLLSNAKDALEKIEEKEKVITVGTHVEENMAVLTVEDNGCGISPEIVDRIFEPFFTTKGIDRGTGLGLDIIRKIVEKMKGDIQVKSWQDRGTVFRITIPLA